MKKVKICVTCSSGGHLTQALIVTESLHGDKFFVTFYDPRVSSLLKGYKYYLVTHPRHNPFLLVKNCLDALKILLKEKPNLIISTGADVTVGICILGKLMGTKIIYIESGGNVYTPSLTGRIIYPFADLFIIQWKPMLRRFSKAICGGPLI